MTLAGAPSGDLTPVRPTEGTPTGSDSAELAWTVAKDTGSIAVLDEFVRRHSDSSYASLARARIEELRKAHAAAAVPSATGPAAPSSGAIVTHSKFSRANVPDTETLPDAIGGARLRAAALAGDPGAVYEVGVRFSKGKGVPVNYLDAALWFRRAEQAGVVPAAFQLGVLYEKGQGVEKDKDKAMMYYQKAAERGNAAAMHNLAVLEADRGNSVSAADWFLKAANRGLTDSQFNLAVLYYRGVGVERDMAESYKWFSLAAARGDRDAKDRRKDVAMRLSDAALATAEQAIRSFVVEAQPDEAVNVPAPFGGWDAPVEKTPEPAAPGAAPAPL